jgi:hypothetical protein
MTQGFRVSMNIVQMKMFYVSIYHMRQGFRVSINLVQMKIFVLAFLI